MEGAETARELFSYAALQAERQQPQAPTPTPLQASPPPACWTSGSSLKTTSACVEAFFDHLRAHGFARLRLDAERVWCVVEMYEQAREFFGLPQYFKDSVCPYRPQLEIGYASVRHLAKEFFAVRLTADGRAMEVDGADLISDEYQQHAVKGFKLMEGIAKDCLAYIAAGLKVDAAKLMELTEDFPLSDPSAHSASFLHLFKYAEADDDAGVALPCPPHTDSGLVTVIPCAQSPGLEILDWETSRWRSVEEEGGGADVGYPLDFVVLVGETLARLTCTLLQASVHRVRKPTAAGQGSWQRYSAPFQLRGRPEAVIDSVALASSVVPDVPDHMRQAITIRDFIQ